MTSIKLFVYFPVKYLITGIDKTNKPIILTLTSRK